MYVPLPPPPSPVLSVGSPANDLIKVYNYAIMLSNYLTSNNNFEYHVGQK